MRIFHATRLRPFACGMRALPLLLLAPVALPLLAQARPKLSAKASATETGQIPSPASATVPAAPPAAPVTPAQQPARAAVVSYANGKLLVKADNSNLNRTLREISRAAGIKLTGSAPDDRVYGTYGPDSPAKVLSELIDGTGSNMLFVEGRGTSPSELILTSRTGGASPPSTTPDRIDDAQRAEPPPSAETPAPAFQPQPLQNAGPNAVPQNGFPGTSSDPNQASPNGVRTPQQIYEQLQRMREGQPPDPTTP